ncbi:MAG: hypothetical protein LQ346_005909 [Caloplaca aetnensis]|nr:MAG: hypothetical protein LQ346_005909 [Caloplaca aetnensis]
MLASTFLPVALLVQLFGTSATAIIVRPEHLPSIFLKNLPNPLPLARSNLLLNFDREGKAFPGKVQRATYPFGCLKAAFDEIDTHEGHARIPGDVYKKVAVAPEGFREADVCERAILEGFVTKNLVEMWRDRHAQVLEQDTGRYLGEAMVHQGPS